MIDRIIELSAMNRISRTDVLEKELLTLRVDHGEILRANRSHLKPDRPDYPNIFPQETGLPEICVEEFGSGQLAAGLLYHGGLLVRGLYSTEQVERLRALSEDQEEANRADNAPLGCTDHTLFELLEAYRECGMLDVVREYLDDEPLLFGERTKLRHHRAERDRFAAIPWHQDVNFFGKKSYGVNCWAAVTSCGLENPGLNIIPRRTEERIGWNEGDGIAPLDYGRAMPEEMLVDATSRHAPVDIQLEPGDAVFIDEMSVHQTALKPWRLREQIVTISWFFRASGFPAWGTPLAV
ncbi:MAG: phytanoyl-CoA dioxygenase family protein [Halioglobus sp.]